MNIFVWKLLKIAAQKKFFFSHFFTFEVPFNDLLPPLPDVGCPIFLEIRNPWGKVMERSGLTFEHFCFEVIKNRHAKKKFFFCWFCLGPPSYGIGATIRIGREMLCLPYVQQVYNSFSQFVSQVQPQYQLHLQLSLHSDPIALNFPISTYCIRIRTRQGIYGQI